MVSCVSVYTVVTYLKNEMNRGDFFMTLRNQPVALSLYRQVLLLQQESRQCCLVIVGALIVPRVYLLQRVTTCCLWLILWLSDRDYLCCQFCKLQEHETLKDLYNQDDDHQELANYYVMASYKEKVSRSASLCQHSDTCQSTHTVSVCMCVCVCPAEVGGPPVSPAGRRR